jgi:hypothetical protein
VQDSWHHLINKFRSRGWDNQLHDEPTLNLTWQRTQRPLLVNLGQGWAVDALPHYGGTLGNVFTYANAGAQVRLGRNLPADFGASLIRPGSIVSAPGAKDDPQVTGELGYNVFAGVDGRAVARNIFLDGNTWRDSHSVTRKPFVADVFCGASVIWRRWTFTYTHVYRSRSSRASTTGSFSAPSAWATPSSPAGTRPPPRVRPATGARPAAGALPWRPFTIIVTLWSRKRHLPGILQPGDFSGHIL